MLYFTSAANIRQFLELIVLWAMETLVIRSTTYIFRCYYKLREKGNEGGRKKGVRERKDGLIYCIYTHSDNS
jgi:hypothetical protein